MQSRSSKAPYPLLIAELVTGCGAVLLLATAAGRWLGAPREFAIAATAGYLAMAALIAWQLPKDSGLGPANRVTLARGVLVCLIAAALFNGTWLGARAHWLVGAAVVALAADGLDGWVARRTGTASAFGARFDMELDAFLILVLCLCVLALGKAGTWVLAIGAMRYLLVAAMWPWPWLAMPLPESWRRKAICVWQVASLVCALSPWVMPHVAAPLLWSSLALLGWSFAVDVRWLHSKARGRA
jgi:phosphatidylglycerophosphate synthase